MKSLKPFLLVIAGMLVSISIFSFKSDEPKKEYATIQFKETTRKNSVIVCVNSEIKIHDAEKQYDEILFTQVLNNMAKEGWILASSDMSFYNAGAFSEGRRIVYLERTKQ